MLPVIGARLVGRGFRGGVDDRLHVGARQHLAPGRLELRGHLRRAVEFVPEGLLGSQLLVDQFFQQFAAQHLDCLRTRVALCGPSHQLVDQLGRDFMRANLRSGRPGWFRFGFLAAASQENEGNDQYPQAEGTQGNRHGLQCTEHGPLNRPCPAKSWRAGLALAVPPSVVEPPAAGP